MRIAYNPSTEPLASAPLNNDITIDLAGKTIYARGVKVGGATYSVFLKHTSTSGGGWDGLVPAPPYVTTTTTRYLTDTGEWKTLNFVDTYNKTEIDDLISGAKTYTDTKIAALVNGAPETLDTLKEISDYLQDSTVVGGLLDLFKKYLPLSGGTISGVGADILMINRTDGENSVIKFNNNGTFLGRLGYHLNGTPVVQVSGEYQSLIHSGNISDYAVTSGTLNEFPRLTGTSPSGASATGTWGINISGRANRLEEIIVTDLNSAPANRIFTMTSGHGSTNGNKPITWWVSGITFRMCQNDSYRTQLCTSDSGKLYYRIEHEGSWADWKTIAFTDSTVAAANKLSTARTIWGKSFDGSGNVDGVLSINGMEVLYSNGSSTCYVGNKLATNSYLSGNNVNLRYGSSENIGFILNSSGNVGIGTTAPQDKLHVNGNGIFNGCLNITGVTNYAEGIRIHAFGGVSSLWFGAVNNTGYDAGMWGITANAGGNLRFRGGSSSVSDLMNITQSGDVGIGTTNPNTKLHVVGGALFTDTLTINADEENPALKIFNTNGGFHLYSGFTENEPFRIDACDNKGVYTNNIITAKQDSETKQVDVNFYGNVFSKNIYRVTEKEIALKLTLTWLDTGIQFNDSSLFPSSGTYVVQVYINAGSTEGFWYSYFSGIMAVYTDYTNADVPDDEIILHHSSHANKHYIYLKTKPTLGGSGNYTKLYIACSKDFTAARNIQFKFKKLI